MDSPIEKQLLPMEKKVVYGAETISLYSIGYLAYMSHRSQATIRRWQRNGILPKPIFDLYDGKRWYTAPELIGYTQIVRQGNVRAGKKIGFLIKRQFLEFRHRLKKVIKDTPERMLSELPMTFSIQDLMRKHRTDYWKSTALDLLSTLTQVEKNQE